MVSKHPPKLSPKGKPPKSSAPPLVEAGRQFTQQAQLDKSSAEYLQMESASPGMSVHDIIQSELHTARMLNVGMTDEPSQFIRLLEARVQEITGARRNVILILDEESGTYTCLNDQFDDDFAKAPRELTWISDHYLQDLLGSEHVIHSFLHHQGNIFGIIALADKADGTPFSFRDEIVLEQLTQYLSVQVNHFLTLKRTLVLPTMQRILLHISNRLLCAVDSSAIFEGALAGLLAELPFDAGQYVHLDRTTGQGHVLYQLDQGEFSGGESLREVDQFVSLLSLFQSQVWRHTYLYLKGEMLGDKSFADLFGLPDVVSVLLLPLTGEDGTAEGALVLFQQKELVPLSKEALKVIEQVSDLVISACGRAQVLEKTLELATTDELTGAVNRRGFYSRFDGEIDRARRNQSPMCLAMIDIDHFKIVNDTYGHLVGDEVLVALADQIHKNIRKSDVLCRFGGEEFALLLPETPLHSAAELLERLRKKVERLQFKTPAGPVRITFSAGLHRVETTQGLSKDTATVMAESLRQADEALYEAKQLGRNRIIIAEAEI